MRQFLIIALTFVLIIGCSSPEEKIDNLVSRGEALIDEGKFAQARADFDEIAQIDDGSVYPVYGSGLVYERQWQFYDALHEYMFATDADPEFAPGHAGTYRIYRLLEDYPGAVNAASVYATLRPKDTQAKLMLTEALYNMGRFSRARQTALIAAELGHPQPIVDLFVARCYRAEHKEDSAAMMLERATGRPLEDPQYCQLMADNLIDLGLIDSAMNYSLKAVDLSNDDPQVLQDHFFRALKYDYLTMARAMMARVGDRDGGIVTKFMMDVLYYSHTGEMSLAQDGLMRLDSTLGQTVTGIYYDVHLVPQGESMLRTLGGVSSMRIHAQKNLGFPGFLDYLDYVICSKLYLWVDEKTMGSAIASIKSPWSNRVDIRTIHTWLKQRVGLFDEAEQMVKTLIEYHATQPEWLTSIGDILATTAFRKQKEARKLWERALKSDPYYLPAFESYLALYRDQDEPKKELKLFDKYPQFTTRQPYLALRQAELLVITGQAERGLAQFEAEIGNVRGSISSFESMAEVCRTNHCPQGLELTNTLLQQYSTANPDGLILAASLTSEQGEYQKALELAEQALSLEPLSMNALVEKARALYYLGNREQAFKILEDNDQRQVNHSRTCYWLSRLLASEERDNIRAQTLARQALRDRSLDAYVRANLSYVCYQGARFKMAAGEARRAMATYPNHPLLHFRRGMALYMEDDPQARETLQKAIDLGLWGEYLAEAKETLKKL